MSATRLIFLFFLTFCYGNEEKPLVQTPLGAVRGYIKKSFEGRRFSAFEGIPYAKPPIGERRFEPPEPVEPWLGIWEATSTTECAQTNMMQLNATIGDEDCLHINVYVPRQNPNPEEKLDVIVHIHGGAYMYLSGHMYAGPDFIMDRDVIFVTFNYRLGILGFLSTEDEVVPGNNGMKDQVLALQWVQKNIASFGGNPKSVTLTGLSAGGSSVHLHYFSEMSKGLFHRGFSQSGVALNSFSLQEGALEKARILAEAVGCSFPNTRKLVDCLKQRHHKHLLERITLFFAYHTLPLAPFAPVVEKGSKPFLKAHPYYLLKKGAVNDVPWILSNTAHEGYMVEMFAIDDKFYNDWKLLAPMVLDFNYTLDKSLWESTTEKIKTFYFGEKQVNKENIEEFAQMYGDRTFLVDAEDAVRLQAKVTKSPVYYFLFSYPGDNSQVKYVRVSHGGDARYFYAPGFDPRPLLKNDIKMKDVLINMLISYAKTGIPKIDGIDWKPTTYEKLTYLDVNSFEIEESNLKTVDELTPRQFWKSLQLLENENLFPIKDEL